MNIKEYKIKYEKKSLVAFLDILGFENMIENGVQDEVLEFLYLIRNLNAPYQADLHITQEMWLTGQIQPNVSSFSDHIIITLPLELTDFPEHFANQRTALFHHINMLEKYIANLQLLGLKRSILFRGAIALGSHYHDWENNLIFGTPLIESISNETKLATYPRVILSQTVLKHGANIFNISEEKSHIFPISTAFRLDFDGIYHVDYLKRAFNLLSKNNLTEIKQIIERGIKNNQNNLNILTKWKWLANYFNSETTNFKTPNVPHANHIYKDVEPILLTIANQ